ncbi:MAG: adenylosuccinate lyase [Pseudomonadota bacterium]
MIELLALSPLDGRYADKLTPLRRITSEFGLFKYRLHVEIAWVIALSQLNTNLGLPQLSSVDRQKLQACAQNFTPEQCANIKAREKITNHDVKALEYYLQEVCAADAGLKPWIPYIHFACTSEDINNLAYAVMMKEARDLVLLPCLNDCLSHFTTLAHTHASLPMLSRTHGQSATPTTLGKEFANIAARLKRQMTQLEQLSFLGKFNGAVGNFNAHYAAYPSVDWSACARGLIESLGLEQNEYTTQIEPHDNLSEYCDNLRRINTILIDTSRDLWGYISLGYFRLKRVAHEVGSSTMPHKINPIDFENAEGNLGVANALLTHFSEKLPVSRWQRDLSDSTVLRSLGVALGHSLLAYQSLLKGLSKLDVDETLIRSDLNNNPEILAEAIQTVLRAEGCTDAYEQLKALTRGNKKTLADFAIFINTLQVSDSIKVRLRALTPENYVGIAAVLAKNI